uniref:Uncharacterized protein n=1 Tax=Solanum lycopersicum TaxID=4081 RepID=K4AW50_SOLLC
MSGRGSLLDAVQLAEILGTTRVRSPQVSVLWGAFKNIRQGPRTLSTVHHSLNYSVMQYLLNTKKKMHFVPVIVLNHFVAPGVAELSSIYILKCSFSHVSLMADSKSIPSFILLSYKRGIPPP